MIPVGPDHADDAVQGSHVLDRVGVEQDEVGLLARFDGAQRVLSAEELGGVEGDGLQDAERRQPGPASSSSSWCRDQPRTSQSAPPESLPAISLTPASSSSLVSRSCKS